jgi:serpin B
MQKIHTLSLILMMLFASTETLRASEKKDTSSQKSTEAVVDALNASAFTILTLVENKSEGNIVISPFSVFSGIAMAYTGSENKTRDQISEAFHISKNKKPLLDSLKSFFDTVTVNSKNILRNSNSIWIQDNYKIKTSYTISLEKYFATDLHRMNVLTVDSQEFSRKRINDWVEKETSGKIKELITPGILDNNTRLLLINAIYFKDAWKNPFNKVDIVNDTFYLRSGNKINSNYLRKENEYYYYEDIHLQALEIPYKNADFSMLVILPKDEVKLDLATYSKIMKGLKKENVNLWLPKFKTESSFELKNILSEMGITDAFNGKADFSDITGNKELFISNILHKAVIEVNEKGTEAAGSTAVVARIKSARVVIEPKIFKANHPFAFMLIEKKKNAVLFIGKLNNPNR